METSLVHCLGHCYSCFALVTIQGNELVIFPCIAVYSDDKYMYIVRYLDVHGIPHLLRPLSDRHAQVAFNHACSGFYLGLMLWEGNRKVRWSNGLPKRLKGWALCR